MEELIKAYEVLPDVRQEIKVKHKLIDIVIITILATFGNADEWEDIEIWGNENKEWLKNYLTLENGIPSHDTIQRNIGIIDTTTINIIFLRWLEEQLKKRGIELNKSIDELNEEEKIVAIDGKTARGSRNKYKKAVHILTAYMVSNGICLAQLSTDEKSNEITAIPDLLDMISIEGQIVTIDAMGAQKAIAKKIIKDNKADYVLGLKGNQKLFARDVADFFDEEEKRKLKEEANKYFDYREKSHGMIIRYECYATEEVNWLTDRNKWEGLKTIAAIEKSMTNIDTGEVITEIRNYICSIEANAEKIYKITRGHWNIETSLHWHLDVSFREDNNKTIDRKLVENMNVIRKITLSILKLVEFNKKYSIKKKRYLISCNSEKYIPEILNSLGNKIQKGNK